MFFVFSKLLSILISPLTWVFILLVLTILLRKKTSVLKYLLGTLLIFYLFSNQFIVESILRQWEIASPQNSQLKDHYEAGIVLGGGLVAIDEENDRLVYGQSADRILQAIDMYQLHKIDKIIISGGSGSLLDDGFVESVLMKKFLINIGISSDDILVDSLSRNTHENAVETKKLIETHFPDGNFLLFTSAVHMRRAQACFIKQQIHFDSYSTNRTLRDKQYSFEYLFLPSSLAIYQWESFLHEITGMVAYKIMGYV